MIYFDSTFIAKCYLNEPGAEQVRRIAEAHRDLVTCELARVEMASVWHRARREQLVPERQLDEAQMDFENDSGAGVWRWLPLDRELVELARAAIDALPASIYIRSGDALHLACARRHRCREVYSNDRHLLTAAPYFQLNGINPIQ